MNEVDRHDMRAIARAISGLGLWEKASKHNWALVPQSREEPQIVTVVNEKGDGPISGRLLIFPGFQVFSEYVISRRAPDFGVAMSPVDLRHIEMVGLKGGGSEVFIYEPGFVPLPPSDEQMREIASMLYECYGMMLRIDEDGDLPLRYSERNAMFARKEVVGGVWQDGPLAFPEGNAVTYTERVQMEKSLCSAAAVLPVYPKDVWEVDFVMVPSFRTSGPRPRFLYLLAAVDAESGERMLWEKMSVDGKDGGLLRMWEGHAERLLKGFLAKKRVAGEVHVRSGRMMRFLRPLGMHLPFKLVQNSKLPSLDGVLDLSIKTGRL